MNVPAWSLRAAAQGSRPLHSFSSATMKSLDGSTVAPPGDRDRPLWPAVSNARIDIA